MISDAFINMAAGFVTWLGSLFPDWPIPGWMTDPSGLLGQIATMATGLGVWVPWAWMGGVLGVIFASWFAVFLVHLIRVIIAHLPFVGGNG